MNLGADIAKALCLRAGFRIPHIWWSLLHRVSTRARELRTSSQLDHWMA